jgi:hypothetical protein
MAPTATPTSALSWPDRRAAILAGLVDMGMTQSVATEGAYWLTCAAISAETGADHYSAEAELARAGVQPPEHVGSRWSRLRPGDAFSPGTSAGATAARPADKPAKPPVRKTLTPDAFLAMWDRHHGAATVEKADIHPEIRAALKPAAWAEDHRLTDDEAANIIFSRFGTQTTGEGRVFEALDRRPSFPPPRFRFAHPDPFIGSPKLKDPDFAPWQARFEERARAIFFGPEQFAGAATDQERASLSLVRAFAEIAAAYSKENGVGRNPAEAALRAAGVHP